MCVKITHANSRQIDTWFLEDSMPKPSTLGQARSSAQSSPAHLLATTNKLSTSEAAYNVSVTYLVLPSLVRMGWCLTKTLPHSLCWFAKRYAPEIKRRRSHRAMLNKHETTPATRPACHHRCPARTKGWLRPLARISQNAPQAHRSAP